MFAKHLGITEGNHDGDDDYGKLSAPFAWMMFMHTLILGDSDAGKTWVVINILLHEFSPYLPAYEKIVVIGARKGDAWYQLALRFAPDKFLLFEDLDENIFVAMTKRKNKKLWLVVVDDKIGKMKEFAKMIDLTRCRHDADEDPCCHFWLLVQYYMKVPKDLRKQFKYSLILQSFAADKDLLERMVKEGVIPGIWSVREVQALCAAATGQEGDEPWYFLFVDKKHRKMYRGFEARLDPKTAKVIEWEQGEEPMEGMEDDTLKERIEADAPEEYDWSKRFTEEDLLQLAQDAEEEAAEKVPLNKSEQARALEMRLRKHAGTHGKMEEVIGRCLKVDESCVTKGQCFTNDHFIKQVGPYKYELLDPFKVDEFASPQTFKKVLRKVYPNLQYDRRGKFYKHLKFVGCDDDDDEVAGGPVVPANQQTISAQQPNQNGSQVQTVSLSSGPVGQEERKGDDDDDVVAVVPDVPANQQTISAQRPIQNGSQMDIVSNSAGPAGPPSSTTGDVEMQDVYYVLSLFDGIAALREAMRQLGIPNDRVKYFASEIDTKAMTIANDNFPDIIQLGDVTKIHYKWRDENSFALVSASGQEYPVNRIFLMGAGSPCQGFSGMGNLTKMDHASSMLFDRFMELLALVKPNYWLAENVVGPQSSLEATKGSRGRLLCELTDALESFEQLLPTAQAELTDALESFEQLLPTAQAELKKAVRDGNAEDEAYWRKAIEVVRKVADSSVEGDGPVDPELMEVLGGVPDPYLHERGKWWYVTKVVKSLVPSNDRAKRTWDVWSKQSDHYDAAGNEEEWGKITDAVADPMAALRKLSKAGDDLIDKVHRACVDGSDEAFGMLLVELYGHEWRVVNFGKNDIWAYDRRTQLWRKVARNYLNAYVTERFGPLRREYIKALNTEPKESDRFFPVIEGEDEDARKKKFKSALKAANGGKFTRNKNGYKDEFFGHPDLQDSEFELKLNADPNVMSFQNGVVDLRDGVLRERRFDDYLSKCIDLEYNPDAPRNTHWEAFIHDIFDADDLVAKEIVDFMQVWLGYSVTGHNTAQQCCILYGHGSNGKSLLNDVLIKTLRCTAGKMVDTWNSNLFDDAASKKESSNQASPELAKLVGCNIGLVNETAEGLMFAEQMKKLVDNTQSLTYRQMYESAKALVLITKFMLSTNCFPMFPCTECFIRRINVIPMNVTFVTEVAGPNQKVKDTGLFDKMTSTVEARQGIVNWMVEGARQYYARGKVLLPLPECCERLKREYVKMNDWCGFFEFTGNKDDQMTWDDIWGEINQRTSRRDLTRAKITKKIVELGAKEARVRRDGVRRRVFCNIKPKLQYEELEEAKAGGWLFRT